TKALFAGTRSGPTSSPACGPWASTACAATGRRCWSEPTIPALRRVYGRIPADGVEMSGGIWKRFQSAERNGKHIVMEERRGSHGCTADDGRAGDRAVFGAAIRGPRRRGAAVFRRRVRHFRPRQRDGARSGAGGDGRAQ